MRRLHFTLVVIIIVGLLTSDVVGFVVVSNARIGNFRVVHGSSLSSSEQQPQGNDEATEVLMSMIQKRDLVIHDLEKELDNLGGELRERSTAIEQRDQRIQALEVQVQEKSNMLDKRDQLIENLEEEIVELENQLKSVGKFKEKKPPMKGRKVVSEEEDWVDPLQDVQGSLIFHLGMTIRLTLITLFFRIPKFILTLPKKLWK